MMNEAAVPTYTKKAIKVSFYYRCLLEGRFFFLFLSFLSFFFSFCFAFVFVFVLLPEFV